MADSVVDLILLAMFDRYAFADHVEVRAAGLEATPT